MQKAVLVIIISIIPLQDNVIALGQIITFGTCDEYYDLDNVSVKLQWGARERQREWLKHLSKKTEMGRTDWV